MAHFTRRGFSLGALATAGALSGCAPTGFVGTNASADKRAQNLLLIIVDDLNDWVTALGNHPQVTAPHMKALAASGTTFANAHAQAPICGPSRASLDKRFKWESNRTHTDWGAWPATDDKMIDHITASWGVEFLNRQHTNPFMLALGFVRPQPRFGRCSANADAGMGARQ